MFKKSGKKCFRLLNFCDLQNNHGNFQRHIVWMAFKLVTEISTVKVILWNIFLTAFFTQRKIVMEISNVTCQNENTWKFPTSF